MKLNFLKSQNRFSFRCTIVHVHLYSVQLFVAFDAIKIKVNQTQMEIILRKGKKKASSELNEWFDIKLEAG